MFYLSLHRPSLWATQGGCFSPLEDRLHHLGLGQNAQALQHNSVLSI